MLSGVHSSSFSFFTGLLTFLYTLLAWSCLSAVSLVKRLAASALSLFALKSAALRCSISSSSASSSTKSPRSSGFFLDLPLFLLGS